MQCLYETLVLVFKKKYFYGWKKYCWTIQLNFIDRNVYPRKGQIWTNTSVILNICACGQRFYDISGLKYWLIQDHVILSYILVCSNFTPKIGFPSQLNLEKYFKNLSACIFFAWIFFKIYHKLHSSLNNNKINKPSRSLVWFGVGFVSKQL